MTSSIATVPAGVVNISSGTARGAIYTDMNA